MHGRKHTQSRNAIHPVISMSLISSFLLCTLVATATGAEIHYDFRIGPLDPKIFQVEGAGDHMKAEAVGLHINPAANIRKSTRTGVGLRFRLQGDFEITAPFEILESEVPKTSYGVSALVRLETDRPVHTASLGRILTKKDGPQFRVIHRDPKQQNNRRHKIGTQSYPTKTMTASLRIVRKGEVLHFLVAEDDRTEFRELYQTKFTDGDLTSLKLLSQHGLDRVPPDFSDYHGRYFLITVDRCSTSVTAVDQ